jgi:hypothetical protein
MSFILKELTNTDYKKDNIMNMNLGNEADRNELQLYVENYFMIEFVAVPPDFDIGNYLTLREHVGVFEHEDVVLDQVKKIADSVKFTPVTCLLNNALLDPRVGMFLLSIFNELGLILNSIPNPLRKSMENYKEFLDRYSNNTKQKYSTYIRGQEAKTINIVIVNLFPMMNQHVIDEAMKIAKKLQKYQAEVDEKIASIGKL